MVQKTKEHPINISDFKTDVTPILGRLGEGKEFTTPNTAIRIPELWNDQDRVWGVYPRETKSLLDQKLKLQAVINRELEINVEARLLASKLLGKCGMFLSHLNSYI